MFVNLMEEHHNALNQLAASCTIDAPLLNFMGEFFYVSAIFDDFLVILNPF